MIDMEVNNKKDCMGCHACSNICPQNCISMECDNDGFWYPHVNYNKCIKCKKCINTCPIINKRPIKNDPKAYACINKNETIRLKSSSGGIFTLVAEQVIDSNGVIFGVGFDEKFRVKHSYVENKEELGKFRGSKYVQSKIGETYKKVKVFLKQGRTVLFTGTPCQIGGLKSYLGKVYDNLFCMDIICHGVPSPKVWDKYVIYIERKTGLSPLKISFRDKQEGWKRFSISFLFTNNEKYHKNHKDDIYMKAFLKNISLRPSCYDCKFKSLHRESDLTLADFWGVQNELPEMDDDKGTSLIIINSDKGKEMLGQLQDKIIIDKVDIHEAVRYNSAAIKSVNMNPKRKEFFEELENIEFDKLVNKYCNDSLKVRIVRKIKRIIKKKC